MGSFETGIKKECQIGPSGPILAPINRETRLVGSRHLDKKEIIKTISSHGSYEVVFVEGAKDPIIPKIKFGGGKERANTIFYYQDNFDEIIGVIKNELKKKTERKKAYLIVNGKCILLTEFSVNFIKNTIFGMIKSLNDVDKIEKVEICFTN